MWYKRQKWVLQSEAIFEEEDDPETNGYQSTKIKVP